MEFDWILAYLALGAVTGIFAGLFGIGGGGIMVPVLTYFFVAQGFPADQVMHLALGTSMAAIVPTAIASMGAHHQHNAVFWSAVQRLVPGVLVGTFAATFFASYLPAQALAIFFVCFMVFIALQFILDRKPKPARQLPSAPMLTAVGAGIGSVSALVAIGGGTLTVPFLVWCNLSLPTAIGTSAAVGLPIALAGALGYLVNGWSVANLPAHTLGYIYWPAVIAMALMSSIAAPAGAKLAHRLSLPLLKKLFALLLVGLALQMLVLVFRS